MFRLALLFLILLAAFACSDSSHSSPSSLSSHSSSSSPSSQSSPAPSVELLVAVAASAQPVFEDLGAAFTKQTGIRVQLSPGASGLLLKQVQEGAPYDLFVSADMARPQQLAKEG